MKVSAHDLKRFDDILETLPRKWTVGLCISERQLHKSKVSALQERDCERRQREVVRAAQRWVVGAGRRALGERGQQGVARVHSLIADNELQRIVVAGTWGAARRRLDSDRRGAEPTAADAIRSTTEWPLRTADRLRLRGGRRRREVRDLRNPAPPIVASETDGERNREGKEGLRGARTRSSATLTAAPLSTLHNAAWTARDAFAVAREKRSPRRPRRGTPTEFKQLCGDRP
uniref:SFRICE_023440 n=1 Tax=Spodoptera frugiperda TaxID=7108 RepID=A0A2H1V1A6_SPOFR